MRRVRESSPWKFKKCFKAFEYSKTKVKDSKKKFNDSKIKPLKTQRSSLPRFEYQVQIFEDWVLIFRF